MRAAGPRVIQTSLRSLIGPDAIHGVIHPDGNADGVDRALGAFRDITSGG